MQYHLNGFYSGDPCVTEHSADKNAKTANVDVLIIGCGPAGLTLAAQLCEFQDLTIRIVERKPGPLAVGQADGIACRSVEMFQAFGFAEKVLKEAYWVNEVAFWRPEKNGAALHRAELMQDVETGLSEMPHVILNQARVHDFYLEKMCNSAHALTPEYNRELTSLSRTGNAEYPLCAHLKHPGEKEETETIAARFVVGCDGARSRVRQYLNKELKGESARQLWGVMDVLAVSNFPDIRKKVAIQSAMQGSMLIIPREGGYLVRLYIELDELHGSERAADRNVTPQMLTEKACAILSPYTLDVKQMVWWSAYEIGQRVCDAFDNTPNNQRHLQLPNVFIAGDACHTHSPKAGQGMNVGMADAFNLGWKLAAVIRRQAKPELLHTYSLERQDKARELIEFDKDMARLFSDRPTNTASSKQFQQYFKKHIRYTAGVETQYQASMICGNTEHQALARGFSIGMRFHSETVMRLSDARAMQLGHTLCADGRWRIIAFAGSDDCGEPENPVSLLCRYLTEDSESPVVRHTPTGADVDSVIDVRAVFQSHHHKLAVETMPALLTPSKGTHGLIDYEKIYCANVGSSSDIFDTRAIDRNKGALVLVRPDQYVANVIPLKQFKFLSPFFANFMQTL